MTIKQSARDGDSSAGFTIIEILVVLAILGIVAAVAIAAYVEQIDHARIAAVAGDLRTFETGFVTFASDHGEFPPDSHLDPPYHLPSGVGIEDYLPLTRWVTETPLGGNYNWEGPDSYAYAGFSLFAATVPASTMAKLDDRIDDGDLSQGRFRVTANGRYTYIIDE